MLAKSAILLLGMIGQSSKGAYEITKNLEQMNVRWWLKISDATVYSTLRVLEKKKYIQGEVEKQGKMPERTVYTLTKEGMLALHESIREAFCEMDYDTTIFSIAASYAFLLPREELRDLLSKRMKILEEYQKGIEEHEKQIEAAGHFLPVFVANNISRMKDIVLAEIASVQKMNREVEDVTER